MGFANDPLARGAVFRATLCRAAVVAAEVDEVDDREFVERDSLLGADGL